jgi:hypothetical protein
MDNNERELLIRCLANCDDIDRAKDILEVKKCNDRIKELLSSIVIFGNVDSTILH